MKTIQLILLLCVLSSCSDFKELINFKRTTIAEVSTVPSDDKDVDSISPAEVIVKKLPEVPIVIPQKSLPVLTVKVKKYCELIDTKFERYGWGKSLCENYKWHHVRNSYLGRPLIWVTFGDEKAHKTKIKNMTMIFCTVHGDEITPTKFCFDILKDLAERYNNPEFIKEYQDSLVVVAPIVNPDSFFKKYPTRTNYRKVDVNRNFPTKDWKAKAIKLWKARYKSDVRRFPGTKALSEQETLFQVNLIKRYKPSKIISVHAPLTILDYDGPHKNTAENANLLLIQMSNDASGYRIKDYPFFTGSLGNWAGNERNIPTYTLELPSSDNRNSKKYWERFKVAIRSAVKHDLRKDYKITTGEN
jgi:murein peptide amidase A